MGRIVQTGFSVVLVVGGLYFLFLYLRNPTQHALLHNGGPGIFWAGLGLFLLWYDYNQRRKATRP